MFYYTYIYIFLNKFFRDSIFIFISNIGAESVAHSLLEYLDKNGNRDAVELEHFEDLIRKKAYNAGWHDFITTNLCLLTDKAGK